MKDPQGLTQADFADKIGRSQPYICKLIRKKIIPPSALNSDGTIIEDKALEAMEKLAPYNRKEPPKKNASYYDIKADHEKIKLTRSELELDEKRGTLVKKDEIKKAMIQAAANVRAQLLAIPTKVAPDLIDKKDISEIETIIRRHINEALTELAIYVPDMYQIEDPDEDPGEDPQGLLTRGEKKRSGSRSLSQGPGEKKRSGSRSLSQGPGKKKRPGSKSSSPGPGKKKRPGSKSSSPGPGDNVAPKWLAEIPSIF